ncbi:alpha/beta hydrolase [Brevibacillus reuszeri]|uniref:Alpha/beta hydrolase n=1 Tax=Brevibacillus reuszeri TaxID=54915 RepID=A0A0K9Z1B1_9BACL|nr:alpha/beta hydrolase [Brevibacillus reuszeri]KNB74731.1 hypothetical protein ADS79_01775 [Brevibacillus reuszeri]MED1856367.1 alpha/beta hydrolase [Brevibacillus reuszeri]GED67938.1 alpha/beta hydrolase [Brevibacillus reuszeri]
MDDSEFSRDFEEAFYTCAGSRMFTKYSRKGAPTVLFLAGMGDSCETWKGVQNRIAQITSTFSYDRAGTGRSDAVSGPRTCHDLAQELAELVWHISVEPPFIIVGHSFGGLVARLFASYYPSLVEGLVLVDAAVEYKELAYEEVLPKKLQATNRAYLEDPMLNHEKIDKLQSYKQVAEHPQLGNIPLAILTRGLPDHHPDGWPQQEILQMEQELQIKMQRLSTISRCKIAQRSRHYIHHDEPECVIEEIEIMIKGIAK